MGLDPVVATFTVANSIAQSSRRRARGHGWSGIGGTLTLRIAATVVMCIAATAFAGECVSHLQTLASEQLADPNRLVMATVALVASIAMVLVLEIANLTRRFRGPEQQLRAAMQRIRAGDVGFRLALRRGEPLSRLLHECNSLLEWLNRNPPGGARVDGDVFEVDVDGEEPFEC